MTYRDITQGDGRSRIVQNPKEYYIYKADYLTYASLGKLSSFSEYYRKGGSIHLALKCPTVVCCCHTPKRLFHAIVYLANDSLHCLRLIMGAHITKLLSGTLSVRGSEGFLADFLEYCG